MYFLREYNIDKVILKQKWSEAIFLTPNRGFFEGEKQK